MFVPFQHSNQAPSADLSPSHAIETFVDFTKSIDGTYNIRRYQKTLNEQSFTPGAESFAHLRNLVKELDWHAMEGDTLGNIRLG
jgi:hypothetical protein